MADELDRLAGERATGELRLGDEGAFFLTAGAVTFAESEQATDLDSLLAAAGREEWEPGRPAGAGLETHALLAVFDAAYFLLGSAAVPEFTEGATHRFGPICRITPGTLACETRRRHARLESEWPSPAADRAPVVPVRRVRRQRVILTGLQAEILLNADGRRTPAELARELGRTVFGCLLAVRTLAAAGLVRAPAGAGDAPVARPERGTGGRWAAVDEDLLLRLHQALREFT